MLLTVQRPRHIPGRGSGLSGSPLLAGAGAPRGEGSQSTGRGGLLLGQMRHSLNPQIIDRAPSLLKGPQCLLQLGGDPAFPHICGSWNWGTCDPCHPDRAGHLYPPQPASLLSESLCDQGNYPNSEALADSLSSSAAPAAFPLPWPEFPSNEGRGRRKEVFLIKSSSLALYPTGFGVRGSSLAIALSQPGPHTKESSLMGGLTPTNPVLPAAHSANSSGEEIDHSVLSVGPPQSPLPGQCHQATMEPNVFLLEEQRRAAAAHSCLGFIHRSRWVLAQWSRE